MASAVHFQCADLSEGGVCDETQAGIRWIGVDSGIGWDDGRPCTQGAGARLHDGQCEAKIAPDGHVEDTRVIGGSPLLVNAATDALRKWRFEAGPKETTEIVEFTFNVNSTIS